LKVFIHHSVANICPRFSGYWFSTKCQRLSPKIVITIGNRAIDFSGKDPGSEA